MKDFVCAIVFLLCISSLCGAQLTLRTCGDADEDETCSFFFDKVSAAFEDDTVLYTLRKSFFPTEGGPPSLFDVFMTINVENVPNITCKDPNYEFGSRTTSDPPTMRDVCGDDSSSGLYTCGPRQWTWEHQWSKTIINFIIEREDLDLLQDTNFIAFAASTFNSFDTSVFSEQEGSDLGDIQNNNSLASAGREAITFFLTIDFLPCVPDDQVLLNAWEDILPWIELYAKNSDNLENVEYGQGERGYAFRESANRKKGLTLPLLTTIHVLLNAAFALAATYILTKYHKDLNQVKGKKYQAVASIYWSVVFLCFIGVVVIVAGNGYLYYALTLISDRSEEAFGFRLTSDIVLAILVLIELVASIFTPHDPNFFIPFLIRHTLCCNQCCSCCGSQTGRRFLRRAILSFAMWIIILLLQLVIASILPVAIVVVRNPVPSLAFISIMVAMFFCMVVFVAYFLNAFEGDYIATHKLSKEERRKSSISLETLRRNPDVASEWARSKLVLIAQAFIFLVIFGIVSLVIIIYLNFVRAGANANTVGGLFFSLVPSAILGGITWAAKRHLFREFEEEEKETSMENDGEVTEENEEVKKSLIQIGKFSIGPKTRRMTRKISQSNMNAGTSSQMLPDTSTEVNIHSRNNGHQQLPATTIEIEMPRPDTDTASGQSPKEKDEELQEKQGVGGKGKDDGVEDGDAAINVCALTIEASGESSDLGTSQKKHIAFAMDEFSAPNSSHN